MSLLSRDVRSCGGLQLRFDMSIFHLSVKPISRREGRSSVAAAAYRAGVALTDEATGEEFDFTKKGGVDSTAIFAPADAPSWVHDRQKLWAAAEAAEKRKDACTAHEVEVSIPHELNNEERRELVRDFALYLQEMTGGVVDVAIHDPKQHKKRKRKGEEWRTEEEGDLRNVHAHIMLTERAITSEGFSTKKHGLWQGRAGNETTQKMREAWAQLCNTRLTPENQIDHRSHAERGIEHAPSTHDGWRITKSRRAGKRYRRIEREAMLDVARLEAYKTASTEEIQAVGEGKQLPESAKAHVYLQLPTVPPPTPFTRRPTKDEDEDDERARYERARRALEEDADPEKAARAAVLDAIRSTQERQAQAGQGGGMTTEELLNLGAEAIRRQRDPDPAPPPPTRDRGRDFTF